MTKQGEQRVKVTPVKENVVEGVLQNYLDQLLVTATSPQKVEKAILIPDVEQVRQDDEPKPLHETVEVSVDVAVEIPAKVAAKTETVPAVEVPAVTVENEIIAEEVPSVELISVDSTLPLESAIVTESLTDETSDPVEELAIESIIDQPLLALIDQESWSSQGVECLVFSVGGLKLAVPLLLLGGVHEVDTDEVKPLMGQPQWYLGMVHKNDQNLQVIDTASFIMPERTQSLAEQGFKYLIQLEKTPWTIACQSIDDTVRLEANEIKWRGDRGKRAWLAGTVIERMCALIDVSGLLQQVESSCKSV